MKSIVKNILFASLVLFFLSSFVYGQDLSGDTATGELETGEGQDLSGDTATGELETGEGQGLSGDTATDELETGEGQDLSGDTATDELETGEGQGLSGDTATGELEAGKPVKKSAAKLPSWMTGEGAALDTGRRTSRDHFEFGLLDVNFSGVLDGVDIFGGFNFDPATIDALNVNLSVFANPMYIKVPVRNVFVLDVFTGLDVDLKLDLAEGSIKALKKIESLANSNPAALAAYITTLNSIDGGMDAGTSAFAELGLGASKTLLNGRLWVRAAPSLFFTLFYMKQNSVSMKGYQDGSKYGLQSEGSMHLYSAWDLKDGAVNPFASPGMDLTLETLYALWPVLDTGLLISHIPVIPSTLAHRMTLDFNGLSMFFDTSDPGSALEVKAPDLDELMKSGENENKTVMRPTRFDVYGIVKPFKSPILLIRPNIGTTVNTVFAAATFNWGLTVQYNAPTIFSAFIGSCLTEGVWAQRAGIALDFRLFELDLSAALAGASFEESWSAKGLMAGIALKFGF